MISFQKEKDYRILKMMKIADYFSLGNILSGFLSIVAIAIGYPLYAVALLILAVFFDYIDGKVARFTGKFSSLGKDLDSLSDIVSFGIAPAFFGYMVNPTMLQMAVSLFFVACGVLRLARFNVVDVKGFIGFPITAFGLILPIIYLTNVPIFTYPVFYFIYGLFMVSSFRVGKLI